MTCDVCGAPTGWVPGHMLESANESKREAMRRANDSRVRACVSACSRISDEELADADLWQRAHDQSVRIAELEKQHGELLAELIRVRDICLREFGVGIVNEVVIVRAKGGTA